MNNILLLIPENKGTIASVSFNLYNGLCKQAATKVYVVCLGDYSEDGFSFDNVFIPKYETNNKIKKVISRIKFLRKIKKQYNIDISIATLLGAVYWNILSGIGEYKIGVFHTRLSQYKYQGSLTYITHYILHKILFKKLNKFIAVNKSAYNDYIRLFGAKNNIELVYNIHNFSNILEKSKESIESEQEKELFRKPVVLFVGNLDIEIKGSDRLIKAFSQVNNNSDLNLVFIGGESANHINDRVTLSNIAKEYDVEKNVFFLGRKSNPYKYMLRSDILVSPSRDEGLPGVLIEALSLGVHCIATNSSMGVWEILQKDNEYDPHLERIIKTDFGYITPNLLDNEERTISLLADAISKLLNDKNKSFGRFDKSRFEDENIMPHFIPRLNK